MPDRYEEARKIVAALKELGTSPGMLTIPRHLLDDTVNALSLVLHHATILGKSDLLDRISDLTREGFRVNFDRPTGEDLVVMVGHQNDLVRYSEARTVRPVRAQTVSAGVQAYRNSILEHMEEMAENIRQAMKPTPEQDMAVIDQLLGYREPPTSLRKQAAVAWSRLKERMER